MWKAYSIDFHISIKQALRCLNRVIYKNRILYNKHIKSKFDKISI